jgi:hypothetical protein
MSPLVCAALTFRSIISRRLRCPFQYQDQILSVDKYHLNLFAHDKAANDFWTEAIH